MRAVWFIETRVEGRPGWQCGEVPYWTERAAQSWIESRVRVSGVTLRPVKFIRER